MKMKNVHLTFFLIISIIKLIYSDKSMTIYLALSSNLTSLKNDGTEINISSYTQNELSDSNLIKKFTFSYSTLDLLITSSLKNSTLAAFIINNDSPDTFYFSTHFNWTCNDGTINYISLVRDYIWDKNKKIPPLASVIQCINGTEFSFKLEN